jgi:hypothetical protein
MSSLRIRNSVKHMKIMSGGWEAWVYFRVRVGDAAIRCPGGNVDRSHDASPWSAEQLRWGCGIRSCQRGQVCRKFGRYRKIYASIRSQKCKNELICDSVLV